MPLMIAKRPRRKLCSECRKAEHNPAHDRRVFIVDRAGRRRWLRWCDQCWDRAETEWAQEDEQEDT